MPVTVLVQRLCHSCSEAAAKKEEEAKKKVEAAAKKKQEEEKKKQARLHAACTLRMAVGAPSPVCSRCEARRGHDRDADASGPLRRARSGSSETSARRIPGRPWPWPAFCRGKGRAGPGRAEPAREEEAKKKVDAAKKNEQDAEAQVIKPGEALLSRLQTPEGWPIRWLPWSFAEMRL